MFKQAIGCVLPSLILAASSMGFGQVSDSVPFVSDRDSDGESLKIYVMAPDGSNQERLTTSDAMEIDPSLSPDRKRIAFVAVANPRSGERRSTICVMNRDGRGQRKLSQEKEVAFAPSWSPDGKRIAFSVFKADQAPPNSDIVVEDADGSNRKRIGEGMMPSWSPDGKSIAYSKFDKGKPTVYVMDTDGTNSKPLTKDLSMMAVWSPDGKQIAYIGEGGEPGAEQPDLFVMNADGSDPRQLTTTAALEVGPVWSADGKRIYFTRLGPFGNVKGSEIFVININGKKEKQLTKNEAMDCTGAGSLMLMMRGGSERETPEVEEGTPRQ